LSLIYYIFDKIWHYIELLNIPVPYGWVFMI